MKPLDMKRQPIGVGDKVLCVVDRADVVFNPMIVAEVTAIGFDTSVPPRLNIDLKEGSYCFRKNPSQLLVVTRQLEYFLSEYPELQL